MDIEILPVVMLVAGMVLLYGAVRNKNPLQVVQLALQGKDISTAAPIATPGIGPFTTVVPGTGSAAPGEMHTEPPGPRLFPDGSPRYADDPQPRDLPPTDPRNRFKAGIPAVGAPGDPRPGLNARRGGNV